MKKTNETNDKRSEFRCTSKFKETYTNHCKQRKRDASEYIREAIEEKINRDITDTGTNPQSNILLVNKLFNLTLAYSKDLNKEYLRRLEEEIFNENQYYR